MCSATLPGKAVRPSRRRFWPAIVLGLLLILTLPAELIANNRPLAVSYAGYLYFPVLKDYPETTFGGDFETYTDYGDAYLQAQIRRTGGIVWPIIPFSYRTPMTDLAAQAPTPPSARNRLGTDGQQRDVLAWLIYSLRTTLLVGVGVAGLSGIIAVRAGRALAYLPFLPVGAVITLTALDFSGHGVPSGSPSLGVLLSEGRANLQAPWLGLTGLTTLTILLILFVFLGKALRDAFVSRG
jgi:ABC-type microcin C transport system permease subunit YejE